MVPVPCSNRLDILEVFLRLYLTNWREILTPMLFDTFVGPFTANLDLLTPFFTLLLLGSSYHINKIHSVSKLYSLRQNSETRKGLNLKLDLKKSPRLLYVYHLYYTQESVLMNKVSFWPYRGCP